MGHFILRRLWQWRRNARTRSSMSWFKLWLDHLVVHLFLLSFSDHPPTHSPIHHPILAPFMSFDIKSLRWAEHWEGCGGQNAEQDISRESGGSLVLRAFRFSKSYKKIEDLRAVSGLQVKIHCELEVFTSFQLSVAWRVLKCVTLLYLPCFPEGKT